MNTIAWLMSLVLVLLTIAPVEAVAEMVGLKRTTYGAEGRMRHDLLVLRYDEGNPKIKELTQKLLISDNTDALVREAVKLVLDGKVDRAEGCILVRLQFHEMAMPLGAEVVAYSYEDVSLPKKPKDYITLEQSNDHWLENCHGLSAVEFPSAAVGADARTVLDIQADTVYPLTGRIVSAPGKLFHWMQAKRNMLDIAVVRQP